MFKILRIIRKNWKKSLFSFGLVGYGVNYGIDHYRVLKLMRVYCEDAVTFGDKPFKAEKLRRITVVLNPAANKRKAKKQFEKYCAPLLYLSGIYVSILETEREGHAREIIEKIDPLTDAIVIAGGDGTLSETLTGLMRSRGELCHVPVGVLPLGQTNTLASILFGHTKESDAVEWMAEATMAVVKGNTKPIDALRIETLKNENGENNEGKPVYGVGKVEWGLSRELKRRSESLWYLGPLSRYASLVFTGSGLHTDSTAQHHSRGLIKVQVRYTAPCQGCSSCYTQRPDLKETSADAQNGNKTPSAGSRWWNVISLKNRRAAQVQSSITKTDYSSIINESCSAIEERIVNTSDLCLTTTNLDNTSDYSSSEPPHILLKIGPKVKSQGQLLAEGMKMLREETSEVVDKLRVKQIEIRPMNTNDIHYSKENENNEKNEKEDCLSIDNEDYEVRPIKVTVLPNSIKVFCR